METTTSLGQFLKIICHDLHWDYAVFWKLKHRSRMLLTWEDGYCNHPEPRKFTESMSHNAHSGETSGEISLDYGIDVTNGTSAGYPVELAVASMSCCLYSFGEGHIGRVASTGKHCWIFADEFESKLLPESTDELHLQFAVGIKTILLVPVIPHGVVHLGSLHKVNEDPALVAHIRGMFDMFQHNLGEYLPSSLNVELEGPLSSVNSSLLEKMTAASNIQILNPVQSNMEENDSMVFNNAQAALQELWEHSPDMKFHFIDQENFQILGNNTNRTSDTELCFLPLGSTALSFLQDQFLNQFSNNTLEKIDTDEQNLYHQQGDVQFSSRCGSSELSIPAYSSSFIANVYPTMDEEIVNKSGYMTDQISPHGFLNFSTDCELHKALGSALQKEGNEYSRNLYDSCEDLYKSSLIHHTDVIGDSEPLVGVFHGFSAKEGDEDNLLDVMVSSMYDASADISSTRSNSTRSRTTSSEHVTASCQTRSRSTCSVLGENDAGPWDSLTDFASRHEKVRTRSPSKSSFVSSKSSLVGEGKHKEIRCAQSGKSAKLSHIGKKRPRQSDVQKPRPRDRQMIQDRVKELRELVPNGAKCSIDALLDQTVKHMLFLRSITTRAEKLKQCVSPEAVNRRNCKPSEKQDPGKGASWAFEVGSQIEVCPILVKDLEQPGHMLIEMLCEENGLFLEIAQVIRGLELTILKGVMDNRLNKSWAHFIVEASTGFRRMDIFWPLMKLLQRNSSISSII